jgi:SnoaL-like protein
MEVENASLLQRVEALESLLEIAQLIMSYPLALDGGATDYCRSVWSEAGIFDRGEPDVDRHGGDYGGAYGRDTILEEVGGAPLQASRDRGMAHLMTFPRIVVSGDRATATNYNQLVLSGQKGFTTTRVTANRWELIRKDGAWVIERRTLRLLDGSREPQDLLKEAVQP